MNDDELERLLRDSFDAQARHDVPDSFPVPAPRFAAGEHRASHRAAHRNPHSRMFRVLAPLTAAAAVVAVVAGVVAVSRSGSDHRNDAIDSPARTGRPASTSATRTPTAAASKVVAPASAEPVSVKLDNVDGSEYGVGIPVVARFSHTITDARSFAAATTVTVDGSVAHAAWYFEKSAVEAGYPIEGHLRLQTYWPAHAKIRVSIAAKGLTAGTGLRFENDLTLNFTTGAAIIATVDDTSHVLTVVRDGKKLETFPVSLGINATPTARGIKVIIRKGRSISMKGPGYYDPKVEYTQQLTYDGEYLHSAPWNVSNIKSGIDSSNGCTNLLPGDAKKLYGLTNIGDVVSYPNASGPAMKPTQGYGDWDISWSEWQTGGLVPTG